MTCPVRHRSARGYLSESEGPDSELVVSGLLSPATLGPDGQSLFVSADDGAVVADDRSQRAAHCELGSGFDSRRHFLTDHFIRFPLRRGATLRHLH